MKTIFASPFSQMLSKSYLAAKWSPGEPRRWRAMARAPMAPALLAVLALAAAGFGLAACGGDGTKEKATPATEAPSAADIPVVDITVTGDGYDVPDSIPGGLTGIRLHNARTGDHNALLTRLKDGVTLEQYRAAFADPASDLFTLADVAGGVENVHSGGTAEVVLDLEPGRYVVVDLNPGGVAPTALEVTAAPNPQPSKPAALTTVRMSDFAFEAPGTLPAGTTTVAVVNDGPDEHWMEVRRVNEEGVTADQVKQSLSGTPVPVAPSYTWFGGMAELNSGDSGWAILDLRPGVYALVCNVGDPQHSQRGMYHVFTVQ